MYFEVDYITESGCDWVTQTAVKPEDSFRLISWANQFVSQENCADEEIKPWRGSGYSGYQRGALRAGARKPDEAILVVSGGLADRAVVGLPLASDRVTRLDLQVTVKLKLDNPGVAKHIYAESDGLYSGNGVPPYTKLICSPSGDTVYVGKRTSPVCVRVYDASHKYPGSLMGSHWRLEVEYKQGHAREVYRKLRLAGDPQIFAIGQVCAEVQRKQIPLPRISGSVVSAIGSKIETTTPERKIEWLRKTVAPCVARLCALGYENTVREALGLREITTALRGEKKRWH